MTNTSRLFAGQRVRDEAAADVARHRHIASAWVSIGQALGYMHDRHHRHEGSGYM